MEAIFVLSFLAVIVLWVLTLIGLVSPKKFQNFRKSKPVTRGQVLLVGFVGTIILSIIITLTAPDPNQNTAIAENIADASKPSTDTQQSEYKPDYEIISDDKRGNITRKVQVELSKRLTKQQLELIANQIKDADKENYERTFIMYRIEGEKSVAAWATTHFDPNLEIKFIGLNADDFNKLLSLKTDVDGEVIGTWISPNGLTDHIDVIYKKGQQYFKKEFYIDATMKPYELVKDGNTFRYKDPNETQYFVIDTNGDLEYRGESGNVYLAKKIESY